MTIHERQDTLVRAVLEEVRQLAMARDFRPALAAFEKGLQSVAGRDPEAEAEIRLGRAELQMQLGRWPQVLADVLAVLEQEARLSNPSLLVRARLMQARVRGYHGRYLDSEAHLRDAQARAEVAGDPVDLALVFLELGGLHNKLGQSSLGDGELHEARTLLEGVALDERSARVKALLLLEDGLAEFRQGRSDDARRCYEQALELARQYDPRSQVEADAYRFVGIAASMQGRYVVALRCYERALQIYRELECLLGQAKVYGSIGQAFLELSRVDEALLALNKARKICVRLGADTEKASLYGKLGSIYREREEFDRAVEFHLKDVELARRFGNQRGLAFAFHNLGLSYRARGESDEAHAYLKESLERFQELGDRLRIGRLRLDLAAICLDQGRSDEAQEELLEAETVLDASASPADLGRLHLLRGMMFLELRGRSEAGRELESSLAQMSGLPPSALLAETHFELARLHQLTAEPAKAVDHLTTCLALSRQIGLTRLTNRVVALLEQINEVELIRILVEEVEREVGPG